MINVKESRRTKLDNGPIACQGVEGAYSQVAADALFGNPDIMYMKNFDSVFRAVENGLCRYGVLPIENSNAGSVTEVHDLMRVHNFYIVRSVKVQISHMLLGKGKTDIKKIKEIYTHEQAIKQCSKFLEQNPDIKVNVYPNTATAAKFVAESGRTDIAAIASEACVRLYGMTVLARNIQDHNNNYTRFICISKNCEILDNAEKISIMLTTAHKPGALYEVLRQFADLQLNLTKLESRPIANSDFEFMFYFDFQANVNNKAVYDLLVKLERSVKQFVFLGNYSEIIA